MGRANFRNEPSPRLLGGQKISREPDERVREASWTRNSQEARAKFGAAIFQRRARVSKSYARRIRYSGAVKVVARTIGMLRIGSTTVRASRRQSSRARAHIFLSRVHVGYSSRGYALVVAKLRSRGCAARRPAGRQIDEERAESFVPAGEGQGGPPSAIRARHCDRPAKRAGALISAERVFQLNSIESFNGRPRPIQGRPPSEDVPARESHGGESCL